MKTWVFKCLGCGDEWRYYRRPRRCSICGDTLLIRWDGSMLDMPAGRAEHQPSVKRVKKSVPPPPTE